jgi:vacuolar-type H+-ATPase subunit I/STV1
MTKPLLIACILLSLGAAVLGFLNRGTLLATRGELEGAKTQLAKTEGDLDTTKSELEAKKEEVTKLGEARTDLGKAKEELTSAQEQVTTIQTEIDQLKADSEAKDTRIAELEQQATTAAPEGSAEVSDVDNAEMQARLTELETVNQQLQDQNTGLSTQISELRRKEDGRQKLQMRQGLTGTILAVNQAWNFVVLSLGDRQGVVPNAEMLVQRDGQYLGKIRVTSVEPSTSIADILVRTVPRGLSVMPGDRVIYQALRD